MHALLRQFIIPCVLLATATAPAWGQNQYYQRDPYTNPSASQRKPSILDKVNNFGKNLVDGVFGSKEDRARPSNSSSSTRSTPTQRSPVSGTKSYAGSQSLGGGSASAPTVEPTMSRQVRPRPVSDPSVAKRPTSEPSYEQSLKTITSPYRNAGAQPRTSEIPTAVSQPPSVQTHTKAPLHKRLAEVRRTPLEASPERATPAAQTKAEPASRIPSDTPLTEMTSPLEVEDLLSSDKLADPSLTARPEVLVEKPQDAPRRMEASSRVDMADQRANVADVAQHPRTSQHQSSRQPSSSDLLMSKRVPVLSIRTFGPKCISVGKEAAYQVMVENSGDADAENVEIVIDLPEWADVQQTEPTQGMANTSGAENGQRQIVWTLDRVRGSYRETLRLSLVPRARKPIDLAVRLNYVPPQAAAVIEVQEPKLGIKLSGPREVAYGKENVYRMEIVNSGNGDAENCAIALTPIDSPDGAPDVHDLGTIPAGQRKVVEVELTARQTGTVLVQVAVDADGGAHAELSEKIVVLRPELEVVAEGPRVKYTDGTGLYQVVVENKGNASARKVFVAARIPAGVEILRCDRAGRKSEEGNLITWSVPTLAPGAKETFSIECHLKKPGYQKFEFEATAEENLKAAGVAVTQVEAIADLVLKVSDPVGPVATGKTAEYKIHVQNRGTKRAEGVEVVSYFSKGIEPTSVQGQPNKVSPGQVVFSPIASILPGETVVLTIQAEASAAGNHMFRAEVYCKPLGTRLVTEETTHFYKSQILEASRPSPDQAEFHRPESATEETQPLRTARCLPSIVGEENPIRR